MLLVSFKAGTKTPAMAAAAAKRHYEELKKHPHANSLRLEEARKAAEFWTDNK